MIRMIAWVCLAALLQACSTPRPVGPSTDKPRYPAFKGDWRAARKAIPTYDRLETFRSPAEYDRYRAQVFEARLRFGIDRIGIDGLESRMPLAGSMLLAQNISAPCNALREECQRNDQAVVAPGSTSSALNPSINYQVQGVDQGDMVKSWGRFLILLQDERLFSLDMGSSPGQLRLADRVNLHGGAGWSGWHSDLMIQGNHVLVIGRDGEASQMEITQFDISQSGTLLLQSRFFIRCEDEFLWDIQASRLVGNKLLIYTFSSPSAERYAHAGHAVFPEWRLWSPRDGYTSWKPLLKPVDIYRPVDRAVLPTVHAFALCSIFAGKAARCESTALIGSNNTELYVSPEAAYLWNVPEGESYSDWQHADECEDEATASKALPAPATLYRLGLSDRSVTAVRAHGALVNQFAMEQRSGRIHALVRRVPDSCWFNGQVPLQMLSFPLQKFSRTPRSVNDADWHDMPYGGPGKVVARYSANYLVYGASLPDRWYVRQESGERIAPSTLVAVPLREPSRYQQLSVANSIERIDPLGDNLVTFGITGDWGVGATTVDLRNAPQVAGHARIAAVWTSWYTHLFDARVDEDGRAVLGLHTAMKTGEKERGRDLTEDRVQFFTADRNLNLVDAGSVAGDQLPLNSSYECETACRDYIWFENSRVLFHRDRVFALAGRELVEVQLRGGALREVARLNLTADPLRQ